jgi:chemotaxis signal transduction protein
MLLLLFQSGGRAYAFEGASVTEVLPRVSLLSVPNAPAYFSGLLGYRGHALPVVDFGQIVGEGGAREALSSRIVVIGYTDRSGALRAVGVVAENVSHVVAVEGPEVVAQALSLPGAPYLGRVVRLEGNLVQVVAADKLLTGDMADALFGAPSGGG